MISFPPELEPLVEKLAEHVHNSWMNTRQSQGWKLGPERSDERKESPLMVPYKDLPEDEKIIDRATARETILALVALGAEVIYPKRNS